MSDCSEPEHAELARQVDRIRRRADRERLARKDAERLLETKSTQLYEARIEVERVNAELEERVESRTEELLIALERAESASRAKSEFLASMSHEIRTPMHAVLASLDLLDASELDADQRESTEIAKSAARALLALIDDLLDLAKVESGRLELVQEEFDPSALIREVVDLFHARACDRGLALECRCPEQTLSARADRTRLRQVLLNLASNAIKFTSSGSVTIELSCTERGTLLFEVSDTGSGIAREDQTRIFDRYSQLEGSDAGGVKGTGLGVPISAQIVELMGAELRLESEHGRGSRFFFELDIRTQGAGRSPIGSEEAEPIAAPDVCLAGTRVLAVDDNPVNLRVLQRLLELDGIHVQLADGGRKCLAKLAVERFDVVLLDQQMPDLDGTLVTGLIREGADGVLNPNVVIVALTANAMRGELERCLDSGMDGFLSKPLGREQLRAELMHWKAREFERLDAAA